MESLSFLLTPLIPIIRVFGVIAAIMVIIFVHEMGHYLVARWCGIGARVFSLGFGPELFSFKDKRDTQWRIALIPLGGYVKFIGDEDATSTVKENQKIDIPGSFAKANAWARAATVFAGPLFNALFTIIVLSFLYFSHGSVVIEPVIGKVLPGSPAQEAGLKPNDKLLKINGNTIDSFQDVIAYVSLHGGDTIHFSVLRDNQNLDIAVYAKPTKRDDGFGNKVQVGMIGIGAKTDPNDPRMLDRNYQKRVEYGVFASIGEAVNNSYFIVTQTVNFIGRLVQGREDRCQLSGPSKTASIAWQETQYGISSLLRLTAFLSISIGLINLFPLPPLDGGHLMFYLIEGVLGRPVPLRIQEIVFRVGLFLVLALMLFSVSNDYLCWFG